MDGVKRKPPAKVNQAERIPVPTPFSSGGFRAKKEELYITQEDSKDRYGQKPRLKQKAALKKVVGIFFASVLFLFFCYAAYFAFKTYSVSRKINTNIPAPATFVDQVRSLIPSVKTDDSTLKGQADGRINILLLGAAGEKKPGKNLTDTVMIMSLDTKNKKIALLSLPRDLYVNVPNTLAGQAQTFSKINSLYQIGLNGNKGAALIKEAVEKVTGIPIHYYMAVDFDGFSRVIDTVGGINVTVERDILDTRYPGPNYSYQTFSISKGLHLLNGDTALKYVRERHDDPQGDFGRARRQQQVIQAVKNKIFSLWTLLDAAKLNGLLDTVGDNMKTDITLGEIESFVSLSKQLDTQNITNMVVDAWKPDSLLKVSHVQTPSGAAFILVPRVGNYSEIQDLAQNIFNQDELKRRQKEIADEDASIEIINKSGDAQLARKIQTLLKDKLGMKNVRIAASNQEADAAQTTVSSNTEEKKLFTLDELIKKLPATLATQQPAIGNSSADITVTLGSDLIGTYKYEEDSLDAYNKAQDDQQDFLITNPK